MSTTYTGNVAIQQSTNATPIQVTTQVAHNLTTGTTVEIANHIGNPGALGLHVITVIDGLNFTLNGTTGTGVGGGGATGAVYVYPSSYQVPSDGDNDAAASVDGALQGLGNRSEYLSARAQDDRRAALARSAQNFQPSITWSHNSGPFQIAWNDALQQWVATAFDGTTSHVTTVYSSNGQDATWTAFGGNVGISTGLVKTPWCLAIDASGDVYVVPFDGGTTIDVWKCTPGGSFASINSSAPAAPANLSDVQLVVIGSTIIAALGCSTGSTAELVQVQTNALASGLTGLSVSAWILKSNGSLAVAVPKVAGGGSAYTTATGLSWANASLSGTLGGTDVPIDVAWNPSLALWMMAVAPAGGTHTAFYTSTDGLHWTATGTSLVNSSLVSLASMGGVWVGLAYNSSTFASTVVFSFDGVTWYGSGAVVTASAANLARIAASPNQIAIASCITYNNAGTNNVRFGETYGLPDVVLT